MRLAVYAPPEAVIARPDVLGLLQSQHDLRAVILRAPDRTAFDEVNQLGVEAWWLAPGLWGDVRPEKAYQAEFPEVPHWSDRPLPAFEAQWPMYCPTDPDLPATLAANYADTARAMGASGVYCTHVRYHHPANVAQMWGCVCSRCENGMAQFGLAIEDLAVFWTRLADCLRALPVDAWPAVDRMDGVHPLVGWWASLTDSDFPRRWFEWKNATLRGFVSALAEAFRATVPQMFFASNSFEPLWAPLVGHAPAALEASEWYSPLLGYWPTHVRQSGFNLAVWHARLAGSKDVDGVVMALEAILGAQGVLRDPYACINWESLAGEDIAANTRRPYWPVVNGTSEADVPLQEALAVVERSKASGVVLQGVSQIVGDKALDAWY